jgi:ADP-heptose:LPS heptosyltransferase
VPAAPHALLAPAGRAVCRRTECRAAGPSVDDPPATPAAVSSSRAVAMPARRRSLPARATTAERSVTDPPDTYRLRSDAPIAVLSSRESIGDCFLKLPLLRALRQAFPEHAVSWIVSEGGSPFATVLARVARPLLSDIVEEAQIERPLRAAIANLRRLPAFSLVVDTRSNVNRVVLARLLLRYEVFLTATPGYLLSQRRPHTLLRPLHKVRRMLDLLGTVTGRRDEVPGRIELPDDLVAAATAALPPGPTYVGVAPGASRSYKCWPLLHFEALARELPAHGLTPAFLLGPNEAALLPHLRRAVPGALFPGCDGGDGHLASAELTLAIGQRLAAAVVNDTGVGHLLAAADTPLVSLFGPTDPRRWAPHGTRLRVLRAQDFGSDALEAIPVAAVLRALLDLAGGRA